MTGKPINLFGSEVVQQPVPAQQTQDIDVDELDVGDEGNYDYVDKDDFSSEENEDEKDNDQDYVYSESSESSDEDVQTLVNERKFIVFESKPDQLFITCKECGSLCEIEKNHTRSMVKIKTVCCNNHIFEWRSQPDLNNLPAGNVLIPSAIVFTGGTYEPIK